MNIGPIARYLLEIIQRYNLEAHAPDARRAVQLYRLGLVTLHPSARFSEIFSI